MQKDWDLIILRDIDKSNLITYLFSELKAEVLRLRGMRVGYEKQFGVPYQLLDRIKSYAWTSPSQFDREVMQKQKEIDKLKDQLKRTEEQLAVTQM